MKKIHLTFILSAFFVCIISCSPKKASKDTGFSDVNDSIVMTIDSTYFDEDQNYSRHVISLPAKADEEHYKVEIIPGKMIERDNCNHYGLQGDFEQEMDENGKIKYIYKSNGDVFQTLMGCPDDSTRIDFVAGTSVMTEYNSSEPIFVHIPTKEGIELRYKVWKVTEVVSVEKGTGKEILESFPAYDKERLGKTHDGYAIQLQGISKDAKIELIPGITKLVDCNNHWITTNGFGHAETVEFAYRYYTYDSNGEIHSTRMACPDDDLSEKFIHGINPITLSLENDDPIVIFIPKGFELRYRIWENSEIS